MRRSLVKICGLRDPRNIAALARLAPDFIGFVFYEKSPRCARGRLDARTAASLDPAIKKVGVFVDEEPARIAEAVAAFSLDYVQLHGSESAQFCRELKASLRAEVIKAFSIKAGFDFQSTGEYEEHCALFLFDTASEARGGSGETFDWGLLESYAGSRPYLLSGGIGKDNIAAAVRWIKAHDRAIGVDINSKIETEPGLKSPVLAEHLIAEVRA